jgi:hypothetical protein
MSDLVKTTVELPRDVHARVKELAKASGISFGQFSKIAISSAAERAERVVVAFESDLPRAANFSDRNETPEVDG